MDILKKLQRENNFLDLVHEKNSVRYKFESSGMKAWNVYFVLFLYFNQLRVITIILSLSLPYSINWCPLRFLYSLHDDKNKHA